MLTLHQQLSVSGCTQDSVVRYATQPHLRPQFSGVHHAVSRDLWPRTSLSQTKHVIYLLNRYKKAKAVITSRYISIFDWCGMLEMFARYVKTNCSLQHSAQSDVRRTVVKSGKRSGSAPGRGRRGRRAPAPSRTTSSPGHPPWNALSPARNSH